MKLSGFAGQAKVAQDVYVRAKTLSHRHETMRGIIRDIRDTNIHAARGFELLIHRERGSEDFVFVVPGAPFEVLLPALEKALGELEAEMIEFGLDIEDGATTP